MAPRVQRGAVYRKFREECNGTVKVFATFVLPVCYER